MPRTWMTWPMPPPLMSMGWRLSWVDDESLWRQRPPPPRCPREPWQTEAHLRLPRKLENRLAGSEISNKLLLWDNILNTWPQPEVEIEIFNPKLISKNLFVLEYSSTISINMPGIGHATWCWTISKDVKNLIVSALFNFLTNWPSKPHPQCYKNTLSKRVQDLTPKLKSQS